MAKQNIIGNISTIAPPLFKLRRALDAVSAVTKDCYINCMGDSLTVGYLAGDTPSGYTAAKVNSYPRVLAASLRSLGYIVNDDALIGDANLFLNSVTNYGLYDTRVSYGAGWNLNQSANGGTGGNSFRNTVDTTTLSYSPTYAFNALDVIYGTTPGAKTADIKVNGVSVGSINCDAANGTSKLTITGLTRQVQSITVTPNEIGGCYIAALIPRDTTIKQIYLHVIAGAGAVASSWLSATFGLGSFLTASGYQYDLSIIGFGTNEAVNAVAAATFYTNLSVRKLLMQNAGDGDVIFQSGPSIDKVSQAAAAGRVNGLVTSIYDAARSQFPVVDMIGITGSYTDAVAANLMTSSDAYHWIKLGYALLANQTFYRLNQSVNLARKIISA